MQQLFLDWDAWLAYRISWLNSYKYAFASYFTSVAVFVISILFIVSARRAKHAVQKWTNPVQGRRMMRRVLASGGLLIALTIGAAICTTFIFHPIGFVMWSATFLPMTQWNSRLQIDSFAPDGGAPTGPLRATVRAIIRLAASLADDYRRRSRNHQDAAGVELLRSFTTGAEQLRTPRSHSIFTETNPIHSTEANQIRPHQCNADATAPSTQINAKGSTLLRHRSFFPSDTGASVNSQDCLDPWKRLGVSLAALDAFIHAYEIEPDMSTDQVCDRIIKPRTRQRQCCFIDLLHGHANCPDGWLGKPNFFLSHW